MTKNLLGWAPVAVAAGLGALAVAGNAMLSKRSSSRSEAEGGSVAERRENENASRMDEAFAKFIALKVQERDRGLIRLVNGFASEMREAIEKDGSTQREGLRRAIDSNADALVRNWGEQPAYAKQMAYAHAMRAQMSQDDAVKFAALAGTTPRDFVGRFYPDDRSLLDRLTDDYDD